MVTIEESIPTKSDSFLQGIDIFYNQFNDVNFYIEDEEQENFYYEIFKKIFPEIKLEKIFPLRGKDNVLSKASTYIGDKKKIFLVDKDFDDLLGRKTNQDNLFYLDKYSIENYLLEEDAFKEYIIEEKPRIKRNLISDNFKFTECINNASNLFYEITLLHLLVQEKSLGIENTSTAPEKYLYFGTNITLKNAELTLYKNSIQSKLTQKDKRLKLNAQLKKLKSNFELHSVQNVLPHIPGKYLIKYFKCKIENTFGIANRGIDSFIYRLAKLNTFENLNFLKTAVCQYLGSTNPSPGYIGAPVSCSP